MGLSVILFVAILASVGATSYGQSELDKFQRTLEQIQRDNRLLVDPDVPVDQRTLFDAGGYLSFYFFSIDDLNNHNHVLRQTDLNLYGRANIDGVHEFFVRGRVAYNDFNDGDSFDGKGDEWDGPHLDRAIYRFDLARYYSAYEGRTVNYNLVVSGGRQLVNWANGLVLSRDIDGALITASYEKFSFQFLGGRTVENQFDIDSSRPNFNDHTARNFFGGMLSYDLESKHHPFIYGLAQADDNPDTTVTNGSGVVTHFEYNSYYLGIGSTGTFGDHLLYGIEGVFEGGSTLSNSNIASGSQTSDSIAAWALDGRLDYLCNDANNSRFSAEAVFASGDNDRELSTTNTFGGNKSGTTDKAFNAFGLINTGLAFAPQVSNLAMLRVGASTYPMANSEWFKRLQIGADLFVYGKVNSDAPVGEPSKSGHEGYLGFETDLYANWQVTSDFSFSLRYGVFFPGGALDSQHDPRQFLFTGVTLAF